MAGDPGSPPRAHALRPRKGSVIAPFEQDDLRRPEDDQASSEADQTGADADQTSSDSDQTASDADDALSFRDQEASDRDQASADLELVRGHGTDGDVAAHDMTRDERARTTAERGAAHLMRSHTGVERLQTAALRDRHAEERDVAAARRDRVTEELDRRAVEAARVNGDGNRDGDALKAAEEARQRAAYDRTQAARDRQRAAEDRERAAADRLAADAALGRAYVDHLTGAHSRGVGEAALANEVIRAKRTGSSLVFAFVDVDGLKRVNDTRGHRAGDTLLHEVASAIRHRLRPYDPLVRFGGDEFVCAISGVDIDAVRSRFDEVRDVLRSGSISVGIAEMEPGDELADILERADGELRGDRSSRDAR